MLRRLIQIPLLLAALLALVLLTANVWLVLQAGDIAETPQQLRISEVALVLGTSPYAADGRPNRHFAGRMDAAAELYHRGRVRQLLVSGANPDIYYNEPQRMLEALLERGVPQAAVTLDYAGRRTLDSVARAQRIFGLRELIIVSQRFHLYRALYLARSRDLKVQGYAAPGPALAERWRVELRECFARLLALLDVLILDTEAEVLGEPQPIGPLS